MKVSSLVTANIYQSNIERASKRLTEAQIYHPPSAWFTGSSGPHNITLMQQHNSNPISGKMHKFMKDFVVSNP